jgi:hypothetical protein
VTALPRGMRGARSGLAAMAGCCLLLTAGCTGLQIGPPAGVPDCGTPPSGVSDPVILIAQSVPTAQQVPCLRTLPVGWSFQHLDAQSGRTRVLLHSMDRAGEHTISVGLTSGCDVAGAPEVRSDQPSARRYDRALPADVGYRGERYYVFPGGCITYHYQLQGRAGAETVDAVAAGVSFLSRSTVAAGVRQRSHGRLTLDPGGQP